MLLIRAIDVISFLVAAGIFVWACIWVDVELMGISVLLLIGGQVVVQLAKSHLGYQGSEKDELFRSPWWWWY